MPQIKDERSHQKILNAFLERSAAGHYYRIQEDVERIIRSNNFEKMIIRLENGQQRVERMKKTGEKQPSLYAVAPPLCFCFRLNPGFSTNF